MAVNDMECDVIIIGGGMAGSAAAYQLALLAPHLRGVLLERGSLGHSSGGSFGESRMYRLMHSDPYFTSMQEAALKLWQESEQSSGKMLLKQHGLLFYGQADTGETVEGSIPGAAAVMRQPGMPHEYLPSHTQLNARWPLQASPGMVGLFDPQAGSVGATATLQAMLAAAVERGWQLLERQAVTGITCGSSGGSGDASASGGSSGNGSGGGDDSCDWSSRSTSGSVASDGLVTGTSCAGGGSGGASVDGSSGSSSDGSAGGSTSHSAPVVVTLGDGRRIRAGQAVLAAGAWTNDLPALMGRQMALEIWSMTWGHYRVDPGLSTAFPQWYCFLKPSALYQQPETSSSTSSSSHSRRGAVQVAPAADAAAGPPARPGDCATPLPKEAAAEAAAAAAVAVQHEWDGGLYYGFPAVDPATPVVKVGIDYAPPGTALRPASMSDFCHEPHPAMAALMDRFLKRQWRGFQQPVDLQCSPHSMTSDHRFVLGTLPDMPQLLVFAGDCGRAFKFAPLIGRCLAELALNKPPSFDIQPLSPARPAVGYSKLQQLPPPQQPGSIERSGRQGSGGEFGSGGAGVAASQAPPLTAKL